MNTSKCEGKKEVCEWIRTHYPANAAVLDVGTGHNATWAKLLPEYDLDAVEAFEPNCEKIKDYYQNITCADIREYWYYYYDLIIFGDVIEHMSPNEARDVLEYAKRHCSDMIVAVPFLYPQDAIYGNPYERHIQDDLTPELFEERYPGFEVLYDTHKGYCYYHLKPEIPFK